MPPTRSSFRFVSPCRPFRLVRFGRLSSWIVLGPGALIPVRSFSWVTLCISSRSVTFGSNSRSISLSTSFRVRFLTVACCRKGRYCCGFDQSSCSELNCLMLSSGLASAPSAVVIYRLNPPFW